MNRVKDCARRAKISDLIEQSALVIEPMLEKKELD